MRSRRQELVVAVAAIAIGAITLSGLATLAASIRDSAPKSEGQYARLQNLNNMRNMRESQLAAIARMNETLQVELVEAEPRDGVRRGFYYVFRNTGSTGIRGFEGEARFDDIFGRALWTLTLSHETLLPAGAEVRQRRESGVPDRLLELPFENIAFRFDPKIVLLADGTRLDELLPVTTNNKRTLIERIR